MSNMRLTTLNLDDECLAVLGTAKNKSRYARDAIKGYAHAVQEADHFEDLSTKWVAALRHLSKYLADQEFQSALAEYMDETELAINQMKTAGYLPEAIVAAALRHVKP